MVQDSTREDLFAHMENLMTQFTAKRGGRGESFKSKAFLVISISDFKNICCFEKNI